MKKIITSLLMLLNIMRLFAQGEGAPGNNVMTGNLKIYVVITVLAIILSLIFAFLFSMERRLKQLENTQKR